MRNTSPDTSVFERGRRSVNFFLVLDGAIEIFDADVDGRPNVFTTHAARRFTGEMDLFNTVRSWSAAARPARRA